ncbi:ABC transporter permease [Gordonia crocea]|uniref:Transport permease protein n=1 Tax=Gordonia crocea TaxID=589162 RepID=A0A7I9V1V1_9ACTN|nr:ABC transporter permease [Gordonia crocea]GED99417.1 hypothetical protein nbrc107697_34560 [Gordonia crocea]
MTAAPAQTPADRRSWVGEIAAWARESVVLANRQLRVQAADYSTVIQIVAVPALTLLLFKVVFGDVVGAAMGKDSIYATVPLVIVVSAMFGSVTSAVRLNNERRTGLLARLHVLPINRAAELTSRLLAEVVRIVIVTVLLLLIGMAMGFRFHGSAVAALGSALGIIAVAVMFGTAFSVGVLALAVNARPDSPIVPVISLISSLMMFFNAGFNPVDQYPRVLRPFVEHQPMTPAINAMNHLASGESAAADLVVVAAWFVGALVVFGYPAVRGYRRAAVGR